jgi:tetratricopeptide (TPR) repeat protein
MPEKIFQSNKNFYKSLALAISSQCIALFGLLYFVSWLTGRSIIDILYDLWILIFTIPIVGIFLIILKLGSRSSRNNKEMAKIENEFKRSLKKCIKKRLGKHALVNLNPDLNSIDVYHSEIIKNLIETEAKNKTELKYYLYSLLGLYSLKSDNVSKAIDSFLSATSFNPDCIMTKTWLAEAYELIGDASQAIKTYEELLDQTKKMSISLFDYFSAQIKIVKEKGPRKLPPMTGLRYVSY